MHVSIILYNLAVKYSSVIVTGSVAFDEIMDFPGQFADHFHPEKLHQINVSFVVDRLNKQLGGIATNIAYNLSLTTKVPVKVLAAVGSDGRDFLNFFQKNGIETDGIIVDNDLFTATGKVMTDTRDNQIWAYYYGASAKGKNIDLKKYSDKKSLVIISAVHNDSFLHFQKQAIELHLPYLYDPGMSLTWISNKDLQQGIANCRWLVGNDYEIAQILKRIRKTINKLTDYGLQIITTLGERGVVYQSKNENCHVIGYKVQDVIDPTGAGDAWRGGFIAGIVNGLSTVDSLKLGNALASFAVEQYGTVNHRPTMKQIYERARML